MRVTAHSDEPEGSCHEVCGIEGGALLDADSHTVLHITLLASGHAQKETQDSDSLRYGYGSVLRFRQHPTTCVSLLYHTFTVRPSISV